MFETETFGPSLVRKGNYGVRSGVCVCVCVGGGGGGRGECCRFIVPLNHPVATPLGGTEKVTAIVQKIWKILFV